MKKLICIMGVLILTVTGCQKQQNESQREDVQYAVCRQSVLPKELKQIIKEEKKEACHFTYSTQDYIYYVVGYGRQKGKGYQIKVKSFQMDESHIYIDTTLIGVTKERQKEGTSYPYLVLKSQYYEKDAVFR